MGQVATQCSCVVCAALMILAVAKLWMGIEDRTKVVQHQLGSRLRHTATGRTENRHPENLPPHRSLRRSRFFIIPRGDDEAARRWLSEQHLDFVVITAEEQRLVNGQSSSTRHSSIASKIEG